MFLAGHPSQGCFGLQSYCAPCYFFDKASFYPPDFSFKSQLIYGYSSRKRKGNPTSFHAEKCVVPDDVRLTTVGDHMPTMVSTYRRFLGTPLARGSLSRLLVKFAEKRILFKLHIFTDKNHTIKSLKYLVLSDITESEKALNTTLKGIAEWAENLKLTINADKTNYCIFSTDRRHRSSFNANIKVQNSQIKKVDLPTYLRVTLDPELHFSKHIEQTTNKAPGKLNILRKLCGSSWGSRPQTLKSTFCTVIRPVLEYATPIWSPAYFSVKRKLDYVQHRAAKIIIGAVSSTNNEKAEQECGLPPLESRRKLATIKFTNKLRSYGLDHISRRVFDKWKHSTRLKRSSTLQLDSQIRKELNLDHSSLEFLQEPLILKNPPKNTCFELELLQPCSKKEDPVTLRQKGLETIAILSR
ncbi:reverse transcriptase domain-containing protein [Trichonephila clavipes]|nr:reverse transcriptase domain-containing protein [Trichonephila clavipes]